MYFRCWSMWSLPCSWNILKKATNRWGQGWLGLDHEIDPKSAWMAFRLHGLHVFFLARAHATNPSESDRERERKKLSGFPGQIWGSVPCPMLQTVCPCHKWTDGKSAWEGHDKETAADEGGTDPQDWNLLWLVVRWSGDRVGILYSTRELHT